MTRYKFLSVIILLLMGCISACDPVRVGSLFSEPTPMPPPGFTNLVGLTPPDRFLKAASLSADGHILVAVGGDGLRGGDLGDGQLFVIDADRTQVLSNIEEEGSWESFAVSPDGKYIAACTGLRDQQIHMIDWKAGTITRLMDGCWPTWSPDGNQLAYVLGMPDSIQIRIRDLTTNSEQLVYEYPSATIFHGELVWSSAQDRLAFTTHDGLADALSKSLYTINVDGSNLQNITGASQYVVSPHFSPDGNKLLYVDWSRTNSIRVIDLEGQCHQLESPDGLIEAALSSDGSKIALYTIYGLLVAETETAFGQDLWVNGKPCLITQMK